MAMKFTFLALMIFFVSCESSGPVGKVSAADAIRVVQESESTFPGTSTTKAIAGLFTVVQNRGGYIQIVGWSQDYRSGGTHDVWFKAKENDKPVEFHWVIDPDGSIHPANALAQNVTKANQVAK